MVNSILDDTKSALGMDLEDPSFDPEIMMHINSVLSDLNQLGVGPDAGYEIANRQDTWDEFLSDEKRLNNVKTYVFLSVKMLFAPPGVGYVVTAMEKQIEKAEWRITTAADEIRNPIVVETVVEEVEI